MTRVCFTVKENKKIAESTYRMILDGDTSGILRPGQFLNIAVPGLYLRRPISVSDWDDSAVSIIFKVVGEGTKKLAELHEGDAVDALSGLGNGFDVSKSEGRKTVLIGGGAGVPPLIGLARILYEQKQELTAVLGFNTKELLFGASKIKEFVKEVTVVTVDGTLGVKGTVTDALKDTDFDYYYTCGPEQMLKAVHSLKKEGQLSFEARMGCGFGVCMGCSCRTLTGYKRICTDGPVFYSYEVSF